MVSASPLLWWGIHFTVTHPLTERWLHEAKEWVEVLDLDSLKCLGCWVGLKW